MGGCGMSPDYAALDANKRWLQKDAWMSDVVAMGYDYITEMVHKTYLQLKTTKATAKELGLSVEYVRTLLHYIGAKVAPKGGRNYTVLSGAIVRELRIGWDEVGLKRDYIMKFKKDNGLECCFDTLKMALDGRTWGCV